MSLRFDIITLMPDMFNALDSGILGRAQKNKLIDCHYWNPRDYTHDVHHTVDDRPYGGGPGMVLKPEPLAAAIADAKQAQPNAKLVYLSPQGQPLEQTTVQQAAKTSGWIFLCGRYEGIDQRIIDQLVDESWSIGDYILSGGELAAMVAIDAITRLLPGALGDADSAEQDSFSNGLLDHPHYTRPESFNGQAVPPVLMSGDHQAIRRWRRQQSLLKTWQKRPDLVKRRFLDAQDQALLDEAIKEMKQ